MSDWQTLVLKSRGLGTSGSYQIPTCIPDLVLTSVRSGAHADCNSRTVTQTTANLRDEHSTTFTRHVLRLLSLVLRRIEDRRLHRPDATWHGLTSWTGLSTSTYRRCHIHLDCSISVRHLCLHGRNVPLSICPLLSLQCYHRQTWEKPKSTYTPIHTIYSYCCEWYLRGPCV